MDKQPSEDRDLGLRAVVTGASSGIGRAIALALAGATTAKANEAPSAHEAQDAGPPQPRGSMEATDRPKITHRPKILVHFRKNQEGAEHTAAALQALGCDAAILAADLRDADDRQRLIDFAFDWLGTIAAWVNNAGADVLTGEFAHATFEDKLKLLFQTDVLGTVSLSRQVVPRMLRQPQSPLPPSLTFIGWDQAPRGMEGDAGQMFGPAKAAVMAFANSLAQEVAPKIRVNTIAPGWIKTAWGANVEGYWDERARAQSLMGRWGSPWDVARAVQFVCDPQNTFCTGQTIEVNGGWSRTFARE